MLDSKDIRFVAVLPFDVKSRSWSKNQPKTTDLDINETYATNQIRICAMVYLVFILVSEQSVKELFQEEVHILNSDQRMK